MPKNSTYKDYYADIFLSARFAIFQTNGEFLTKFDQSVRYILSMYIGAIDLFTKVFYTIYITQSFRINNNIYWNCSAYSFDLILDLNWATLFELVTVILDDVISSFQIFGIQTYALCVAILHWETGIFKSKELCLVSILWCSFSMNLWQQYF